MIAQKLYKKVVYKSIASAAEQATLSMGQQVNRPYRSNLKAEDYAKGTAAVTQDLTATDDLLTINKQKTIRMYVDDVDKLQNKYSAATVWAEEAAKRLGIVIDAEVLYTGTRGAANTIDAGDFGGSSGSPQAFTVSNILTLFGKINRKLDVQNADVERSARYAVLGPELFEVVTEYIAGKNTILADKNLEFGNQGRFMGVELYMSNNLTATAVLTLAADASNTDNITIAGVGTSAVTFTFVSAIGSTAGNVLISGTAAGTCTNLAALINAPGTTTANGVAFAGDDLRSVQMMVATASSNTVTVYLKGGSYLTLTSSAANGTWAKKAQHVLAGVKEAIDVVVQLEPDVQIASAVPVGLRGVFIQPLTVFGSKVFNKGTLELIDVAVDTSSF